MSTGSQTEYRCHFRLLRTTFITFSTAPIQPCGPKRSSYSNTSSRFSLQRSGGKRLREATACSLSLLRL